jgi:hypothetical protein
MVLNLNPEGLRYSWRGIWSEKTVALPSAEMIEN